MFIVTLNFSDGINTRKRAVGFFTYLRNRFTLIILVNKFDFIVGNAP